MGLQHPLLEGPMPLAASDIRSAWVGPFAQRPTTSRDKWIGRRGFPVSVIDVSGLRYTADRKDGLVLVFTRTIEIQPLFRLPWWVWLLHRSEPTIVSRTWGNGLFAIPENLASAGDALHARPAESMPADVRAWLS